MKLFLTGGESKKFNSFLTQCGAPFIAVSFCYVDKTALVSILEELKDSGAEVLIDSGIHLKGSDKRGEYVATFIDHMSKVPGSLYDYVLVDYYSGISLKDFDLFKEKLILSNPDSVETPSVNYVATRTKKKDQLQANTYLANTGIRVHGIEIPTRLISQFPFYSVSSGRWLNGNKYGITYRYLGNLRMRAYNADNKHKRQNMKGMCDSLDIDHAAFIADDPASVTKFNVCQWIKFSLDLNKGGLTTVKGNKHNLQIKKLLTSELSNIKHVSRVCDTCILSSTCPGFTAGNNCVIERPTVNTSMDMFNVLTYLLSLQAERTMHGALAEKLSGGTINPDVSREFQRTFEMSHQLKEIFEENNSVTIQGKGKGVGIISKLFGANYGRLGGSNPAMTRRGDHPSPIDIAVEEDADLETNDT